MQLGNAHLARVDRAKIVDYLLSASHPDGRGKAAFFIAFGFSSRRWELLRDALLAHARSQPVIRIVESEYGTRYTVEGSLETPSGRRPSVRTVWIMEVGSPGPRFVTAHPARRSQT